jgi:membrane associated rhomboid family serine protease
MSSQQYSPTGFTLLPPVVKNLLIINGLFFLATFSLQNVYDIDLAKILGLYYFGSDLFRPYQLVTYMFIHANFQHILLNMFALWMFGYLLENVWGSKRFLTFYVLTGIGAAITQMIVNYFHFAAIDAAAVTFSQSPNLDAFTVFVKDYFPQYFTNEGTVRSFISSWTLSPHDPTFAKQSIDYVHQLLKLGMDVPTIGASGSVYGILLAFGMMFPNMLVYIYFLFPIKAKWIVIFYAAIELYAGFSNNPNDNVAHFAHLGGMVFGFFLIIYWRKKSQIT